MKAPRHLGWRKNRTREKNGVFEMPDREWLEYQFLTLNKLQREIATEIGCNKRTVATWCADLNIHKPPELLYSRRRKYSQLNKEWLKQKYLQEEMTSTDIAKEIGCTPGLVSHWMRKYHLAVSRKELYGKRLIGEKSCNWRGGTSWQYHKLQLLRAGRELRCEWCGAEGDMQHIHIHHIDHDRTNGDPSNLLLLCYHCNLLEAQLNRLQEKGLATFTVEPGERIEVRFLKKLGESLEDSA